MEQHRNQEDQGEGRTIESQTEVIMTKMNEDGMEVVLLRSGMM